MSSLKKGNIRSLSLSEFDVYFDEICYIYRTVYQEYPYLYGADHDTKEDVYNYLKAYFNHPEGRLIVAFEEVKIAGMIAGIPMLADMNEPYNVVKSYRSATTQPLEKYQHFFYLGEIIVRPEMRNLGIDAELINYIELDFYNRNYPSSALIVKKSEDDHPLKPQDYYDERLFFEKFGYKLTGDQEIFSYATIKPDGLIEVTDNVMQFMERDYST